MQKYGLYIKTKWELVYMCCPSISHPLSVSLSLSISWFLSTCKTLNFVSTLEWKVQILLEIRSIWHSLSLSVCLSLILFLSLSCYVCLSISRTLFVQLFIQPFQTFIIKWINSGFECALRGTAQVLATNENCSFRRLKGSRMKCLNMMSFSLY